MYLLLLVFGGVLTVAGIALAGSGVSIHEHTFDATVVTPGVVAAVGGLLLIGLGLALRTLQRIEVAVASRSQQRTAPSSESAVGAERPSETAQVPLALKPAPRVHDAPVAAMPPLPVAEKEDLPDEIVAVSRLETAPVVEETALSGKPMPGFVTSADMAAAEAEKARAMRRRNGAAPTRIAPRLESGARSDTAARSPLAAERRKGPAFESMWPKGPRPLRPVPSAPTPVAVAPMPATAEPEQNDEPVAEAPQTVVPQTVAAQTVVPISRQEPVSVLKSGVVDGMAYTLYSDGSIEAELPQGTLRFGSITELRNHIEQTA